jgi:hypothetical protein
MLLAASLILLVLAAALLALGVRGRVVDDHPICRKCRFDLVGLATPSNCPECGARLDRPRAIRSGTRRRRPGLVIAGVAILLLMALASGAFLNADRLIPYEPSWMLVLQAQYGSMKRAPAIVSELLARSDAFKLSQSAHAALARRALDVQSNPNLPWAREWASVLTDPSFTSTLTAAQREAASVADANADIRYRPRIRAGQKLPMELTLPVGERFLAVGARSGAISGVHLTIRDKSGAIVAQADQPEKLSMPTFARGSAAIGVEPSLAVPPGEYQLEATCPMTFACSDGAGSVTKTFQINGPLTVVPADQSTVEIIHDAAGQKLFMDNLSISGIIRAERNGRQAVSLNVNLSPSEYAGDGPLITWQLKGQVAIFTRAHLSSLDNSWPEATARASVAWCYTRTGWRVGGAVIPVDPAFAAGRCRLRLTPDVEAAERSLDIERILGDEIVMEIDVTPESQRQAPPPKR